MSKSHKQWMRECIEECKTCGNLNTASGAERLIGEFAGRVDETYEQLSTEIANKGGVKTVNGVAPDSSGNVTVSASGGVGKSGTGEFAEIFNNYDSNVASGMYSHAEGKETKAVSAGSHAEGYGTIAGREDMPSAGNYSHAEGILTTASGVCSHAEGRSTIASSNECHAEGDTTTASGNTSHAEGYKTTASGEYAHSEGNETTASGRSAHAEGTQTTASGGSSHAEGHGTTASGGSSHAEGIKTKAEGNNSHAEGIQTIATANGSHAQGKYNIEDTEGVYVHIVGNGSSSARSNAHTIDWSGNAWFAGTIEGTAIILTSPNGTRYSVTVTDDGTLSATALA